MKRVLVALLCLTLFGANAFAQDESPKPFTVNAAAGLSFGLFDKVSDEFDFGPLLTFASLRGGVDGTVLYHLNSVVAVGPQAGVYFLQSTVDDTTYTFIDLPVRMVAHVGSKDFAIEPFAGYYLSFVGFPFPGVELGARAILGNFFVEGSYVLSDWGWKHITLGWSAPDLFQF